MSHMKAAGVSSFTSWGAKMKKKNFSGKSCEWEKRDDDDDRRALQTKRVRSWSLVTCFFYTFTGVVPVRRIVGGASFHGKSRDQCGRGLLVFYTFILNFYLRFSPFITHTDLHFSEWVTKEKIRKEAELILLIKTFCFRFCSGFSQFYRWMVNGFQC